MMKDLIFDDIAPGETAEDCITGTRSRLIERNKKQSVWYSYSKESYFVHNHEGTDWHKRKCKVTYPEIEEAMDNLGKSFALMDEFYAKRKKSREKKLETKQDVLEYLDERRQEDLIKFEKLEAFERYMSENDGDNHN